MRLSRSLVLAAVALTVASFSFLSPRPAEGAESVNDCFGIVRAEKDNGLDFELSNGCDRSISCQMRWTLQCESATGKVVVQSEGRSGVMLGAGEKSKVFGSADTCKTHAAWTIDNVTFACTPVR